MSFLPINQPNDPPQAGSPSAARTASHLEQPQSESTTSSRAPPTKLVRALEWASSRLNFYRLHLLYFVLTPLIVSGVFYASNGSNRISYVDSLYMVVSAMSSTGCSVVLLRTLTLWQQLILFIMMTIGSTVSISIVTIIIRRRFFRHKFEYLVETNAAVRRRVNEIGAEEARLKGETFTPLTPKHSRFVEVPQKRRPVSPTLVPDPSPVKSTAASSRRTSGKVSADMIHRVDGPVRVNALSVGGNLRAEEPEQLAQEGEERVSDPQATADAELEREALRAQIDELQRRLTESESSSLRRRRMSAPTSRVDRTNALSRLNSLEGAAPVLQGSNGIPRTTTIGFGDDPDGQRIRHSRAIAQIEADTVPHRRMSHSSLRSPQRAFTRVSTVASVGTADPSLHLGFGGFPNPISAVVDLARRNMPALSETVERRTQLSRTHTFASEASVLVPSDQSRKIVPYTSFDFVVGRNSRFHGLTTAQQEELGGVEFRALTTLLRVVAAYWLLMQLIAVLVLAPWLHLSSTYRPILDAIPVNSTWFVFFQVFSAFSNNGFSLVDASMVPFQKAYWLIIVLSVLVMGGNTLLPVFLRAIIWSLRQVVPATSRTRETLQFLLDHPRRCYIYLFPAHHTWFLLFVCTVLIIIDWVSFLVLDIGNGQISALPVGTRIIDGLFQAIAVRTAGFSIVDLAAVAPGLQLLIVVVMYVAVYPIAIGVRSTNVYEEQSLGLFEDDLADLEEQERQLERAPATSFIAFHARKQLAFDMWWLVLALWLLCIIERANLEAGERPYITIFSLIFEVSSCYGAVGLSLGAPSGTSLSGGLSTLSKLVLCVVMIRGRHRGLPLAIDRAVMLPDLEADEEVLSTLGRPTTIGAHRRVVPQMMSRARQVVSPSAGSEDSAAVGKEDEFELQEGSPGVTTSPTPAARARG